MTARHEQSVARLLLAAALAIGSCEPRRERQVESGDTGFAATQTRGEEVMGVDQYTSAHIFEDLPDGGRIVLDRADPADTAGIATIRRHMQRIAAAFRAGDFAQPFRVHAQSVPGTAVMAARRDRIRYEAITRPQGAEVRLRSTDAAAIAAIHAFLAFQRGAHHAAGHEGAAGHHH